MVGRSTVCVPCCDDSVKHCGEGMCAHMTHLGHTYTRMVALSVLPSRMRGAKAHTWEYHMVTHNRY